MKERSFMKPTTVEWVAKAEADFATMERECIVTDTPNYDGICFHAQQCAENGHHGDERW